MKKARLFVVIGFRGAICRDTLAATARESKRLAERGIRSSRSARMDNGKKPRWRTLARWGYRCVRVTLAYDAPKETT